MSTALCFPTMRYILFALFFIASFVLLFSKTLDMVGILMFCVINLLFTITLGLDMIKYVATAMSKLSIADKGSTLTIAISFILNLTSSIFLLMTMQSLRTKFKNAGETSIRFSEYNTAKINQIKQLFVTLTVFLATISINVYFDTVRNIKWLTEIVSKYLFPSNSWFYTCIFIAVFLTSSISMNYINRQVNISGSFDTFKRCVTVLYTYFLLTLFYFPIKYLVVKNAPERNHLFTFLVFLLTCIISISLIINEFNYYFVSQYQAPVDKNYETNKEYNPHYTNEVNRDELKRSIELKVESNNSDKIILTVLFTVFIILLFCMIWLGVLGVAGTSIQKRLPTPLMEVLLIINGADFYGLFTKFILIVVFLIFFIKSIVMFHQMNLNEDPSITKDPNDNSRDSPPNVFHVFASLLVFGWLFFIMNVFNPKTFTLAVVVILRYLLPLVTLALSGYLVYATYSLSLLYRHQIAQ